MSWTLIDSSEALGSLLSENRHHSMVAVDTEFRRRDTFFPQVALLQLCWGNEPYLIDPLQLDDLSALRAFLTDSSQGKLIHSASEDLEVFSHWLDVLPAPLFDTQRAAALLGLGAGQSYRALVAHFFDIELPKNETQSDWMQRPLTDAQAQYAAQDVTYLHPMGVQLQNQAMERNRLDWILEEGARLRPGGKPPMAKFKTAYRLPAEQQRVLSEVVEWRESEARHRDRPRSWILNDKTVMNLARAVPRSLHELAAVENMPKGLVRRAGDELVARIVGAAEIDTDQPPAVIPTPLATEQRGSVSMLSESLREIAESMDIPAEVLMPKADLEHLVREQMNPSLTAPENWSGWRAETVVAPLRQRLKERAES